MVIVTCGAVHRLWCRPCAAELERSAFRSADGPFVVLALIVEKLTGEPCRVGHGGIQAGFRPYAGYLPDEDLSVVVLINSGAADPWAAGESILRAVLRASAAESP